MTILFKHFMPENRDLQQTSISSINTQQEFDSRRHSLFGETFEGLDWNNVLIAGGSILGMLSSDPLATDPRSDIDVFIYGLDEENANRKVREILEVKCQKCQK